jgi:hypothetical protein
MADTPADAEVAVDEVEILAVHGTIWNGLRGRKVALVVQAMARRGYALVAADAMDLDAHTLVFARVPADRTTAADRRDLSRVGA